MRLILRCNWKALDFSLPTTTYVTVSAGTHEVERIPNPRGYDGNVLVLKGTKIGMAEGAWRQWAPGQINDNLAHPNFGKVIDWGDFTVEIVEDDTSGET